MSNDGWRWGKGDKMIMMELRLSRLVQIFYRHKVKNTAGGPAVTYIVCVFLIIPSRKLP